MRYKGHARMSEKDKYIKLISLRGDHYGYNGGLYDLLTWTGRMSLSDVTEEEARVFYENPKAEYKLEIKDDARR